MIVVDEFGNEYGATYPKRARGLVKSGRARFIDENRICLACPPNINGYTEDIEMSDNKKIEATEAAETTEIAEATEVVDNTATKYTIDYVLEQIEKLQQQISENSLSILRYSVGSIYSNDINVSTDEDDSESCNGEESRMSSVACVCEIYRYREETLQKMLAFYEKMYDDLKPKAPEPMDPVLKTFTDMLSIDKPLVNAGFRDRIMSMIVSYADQLKVTANQPSPEGRQDKLEKINMLLAHLSECQNDSAACFIGDELRHLMDD